MKFRIALLCVIVTTASAQECTSDGALCDTHERCRAWKEEGECFKNQIYMKEHCPASCADEDYPAKTDGGCKDYHSRCPVWADLGECEENPTNMKRYCPLSCGICNDGSVTEVDDPQCVDNEERCGYWASLGECSANPGYMHKQCAKSCGSCDFGKNKKADNAKAKGSHLVLTAEEKDAITASTEFGEKQIVQGGEAKITLDIIFETIEYMNKDALSLPVDIQEKCLNRNELCAFWAAIGECNANQAFMLTNCAPSCKTCHLIDMGARCPPLVDPVPALRSGDLNKMFERIVSEAPGNKTLTDEERKELAEKKIPEYTVTVISRPSSSPAIEVSSVLDKTLPPWIITFDNFVTPEEAQIIIDLGYKQGYERSRDVGALKFDGTFDGVESTGRTSENAWCTKECRDHEVVARVMNRMSEIMGIPPENSEDLQLLKYEVGQFYHAHHDYIAHQKDRQCGPRILTFFLYLSDVEAGGGTEFNRLGHTVMPKLGRALLWPSVYDHDPLKMDPRTHHAALPVEAGTKFAANGWIHMQDYLGPQATGCN